MSWLIAHLNNFWLGFIAGPVILILLFLLIVFIARQRRAWWEWYKGLPVVQYPAMFLIIIGARWIRGKYCKWEPRDGRLWISPCVRGFSTEPRKGDQ